MATMLFFDRTLRALTNGALAIAGIGMLFIAVISTADVITYLILGKPFSGASESVEVALAVTVAMTLAYAQYRRDHIVVDIVVQTFSPFGRKISAFATLLTGFFCMALLSWRASELAVESFEVREASFTLYSFPIYPWKILFALGLILATVEFLRQIVWTLLGDADSGASTESRDQMEAAVE